VTEGFAAMSPIRFWTNKTKKAKRIAVRLALIYEKGVMSSGVEYVVT
jgi:hypothetical protein